MVEQNTWRLHAHVSFYTLEEMDKRVVKQLPNFLGKDKAALDFF